MLCFAVTSELDDLRGIAFGLLPSATERLKPITSPSVVAAAQLRFLPDFFGSALGFHYLCKVL